MEPPKRFEETGVKGFLRKPPDPVNVPCIHRGFVLITGQGEGFCLLCKEKVGSRDGLWVIKGG